MHSPASCEQNYIQIFKMKLTCVTATFNCIKAGNRDRLIRCVESVAKLKTEHEHLIYDGASTDGTAELLRELEAKTPGLKVVSEPDTGIYNALNKGVRDAKGEWFYVIGADDQIIQPKVMDDILCSIDCDMIIAPVKWAHGIRDVSVHDIFFNTPYCHQGVITKTKVLREYVGGFDERFKICADYDQMLKLHKAGCKVSYTNAIFACFGDDGLSSTNRKALLDDLNKVRNANFGFNEVEGEKIIKKRRLPWRLIIRYYNHKDYALRYVSRAMAIENIKDLLRIAFWPLVLSRRKIRAYRKGKGKGQLK